jgi:hypothetical protein
MVLLLLEVQLGVLRVSDDANDLSLRLGALELQQNETRQITGGKNKKTTHLLVASLRGGLGVLAEGSLLGAVPVLVEATLGTVGNVIGPNSGERLQTCRNKQFNKKPQPTNQQLKPLGVSR